MRSCLFLSLLVATVAVLLAGAFVDTVADDWVASARAQVAEESRARVHVTPGSYREPVAEQVSGERPWPPAATFSTE